MRLLRYNPLGDEFRLEDHGPSVNLLPPYAILSHTWGEGELSYQDLKTDNDEVIRERPGYKKLEFCARQALSDGLEYFWVDTCCINKTSSAELNEAINSMFRWYKSASVCYVYLSDVSTAVQSTTNNNEAQWVPQFRQSRWFTRAWTLPELLAPPRIQFFTREGYYIGSKLTLQDSIFQITGIPTAALNGTPLETFSVAERFSWAAARRATREEDEAYSLLGIFDIYMPLFYGEGLTRALARIRREIRGYLEEHSYRSRQQFRYDPLYEDEIRILILQPNERGEDLAAHIETITLSSGVQYEALSYTWGQEPALHPLLLNHGEVVLIKPNLFHALSRMRLRHHEVRLWVDAVCINQIDEEERNLQVQRMGDVFSQAHGVRIWMGEEYAQSHHAMDFILDMIHPEFSWTDTIPQHRFLALSNLLTRPWFQRGWVIQEVAFAKDPTMFCGDRKIEYRDLIRAVAHVERSVRIDKGELKSERLTFWLKILLDDIHRSPASRLLDIVSRVLHQTKNTNLPGEMTLELLVELGSHFQTTDPRDSIYALTNLAKSNPRAPSSLVPDYGKDLLTVFADFISHCIQYSGSLDVICRPWAPVNSVFNAMQNDGQQMSLPSWIQPRDKLPFGNPAEGSSHRLHGTSLVEHCHTKLYNAHNGIPPDAKIEIGFDGIRRCARLLAKGVIIGGVSHQSMRMADAIIARECLEILGHGLGNLRMLDSEFLHPVSEILCADLMSRREKRDICANVVRLLADVVYRPPLHQGDAAPRGIDIEHILNTPVSHETPEEVKYYLDVVRQCVWNRRTFRGPNHISPDGKGMITGLLPQHARIGDKICILYGCSVPVVLRRIEESTSGHHWELIGEAYVYGFMDGEALLHRLSEERVSRVDFEVH